MRAYLDILAEQAAIAEKRDEVAPLKEALQEALQSLDEGKIGGAVKALLAAAALLGLGAAAKDMLSNNGIDANDLGVEAHSDGMGGYQYNSTPEPPSPYNATSEDGFYR